MTRIGDAVAHVARLGIDTAPFIYFVERHSVYVDRVREIFRRIDAGELAAYSSIVTLAEVLTQPKQRGAPQIADAYRQFLLNTYNLTLLDVNTAIAERAADLRAKYRLRTPDALQIAVALEAGCQAFLTNDLALRRVTELRVLVLDELEL